MCPTSAQTLFLGRCLRALAVVLQDAPGVQAPSEIGQEALQGGKDTCRTLTGTRARRSAAVRGFSYKS